ncbi:MAG: parallel beta-helix repeat protein [Pseudohongiellaceae bacterium]|jgi:parallel beta-helix repeat protein
MAFAGTTHYIRSIPRALPSQDVFEAGPVHGNLPEALAAALDGDTIILPAGEYSGELRVERSVRLLGVGSGELPGFRGRIVVTADGASVEGLLFRQAGSEAAITVLGAENVLVAGCEFGRMAAGVEVRESRGTRLEDNRFLFSTVAMDVSGGGENLLLRNLVESGGSAPVRIERSPGCRVIDNTLRRCGWTAMVVHSLSTGTEVRGNRFEDAFVGLSIQTQNNVIAHNSFTRCDRGLLLGVSPLGMDRAFTHETTFVDSASLDARVAVDGNQVRANTFVDCRREGALLRRASNNQITGNHFVAGGGHGLVLMSDSDHNTITENTFAAQARDAIRLVESRGNQLSKNTFADPAKSGPGVKVRSIRGPDNAVDPELLVESAAAGAPRFARPSLDGSGYTILWGDFHTHSVLSDGSSSPEELLSYARDVLDLDFVAMSDHGEVLSRQEDRWPRLNALCSEYAIDERFVTLPGYEVTYPMHWDGHYNVYFPHDRGALHRSPYDDYSGLCDLSAFTPQRLLDVLKTDGEEHVVIRHHFGAAADYWKEAPEDPMYLPATEISSVHGVFSGERDVDLNRNQRMGETQGHASSVRGGLESGRVFGVLASSDTHYGFAGDGGLAALLVESVTAQGLVDALRARRTWGTTGARIALSFGVDGAQMGSTISPGSRPPNIEGRVLGESDLLEVAVFRGADIVHRAALKGRGAEVSWRDSQPATAGTYYQLRVRQVDGQVAWSTPVWFDPPALQRDSQQLQSDKAAMSLMLYALQLRAWPRLGLGILGGATPLDALADPQQVEAVHALWGPYCAAVERLNALADTLGPADLEAAQALVDRYGGRWGDNLPKSILNTHPMLSLEEAAAAMGLPLP